VPSIVSSHHGLKGSKKYLMHRPIAFHEPKGRVPARVTARDRSPVAGLHHLGRPFDLQSTNLLKIASSAPHLASVAPAAPCLNLRCVIFVTAIRAMKLAMGRGAGNAWGIDLRFDG